MKDIKLLKDEEILDKYKLHWFIFLKTFLVAIITIIAVLFLSSFNGVNLITIDKILIVLSIYFVFQLVKDFFEYKFNYYIVTNKRIIIKEGFFFINQKEILFSKIETIDTNYSVIDRFFKVGSIIIKGTGNSSTIIDNLKDTEDFKEKIFNIINKI